MRLDSVADNAKINCSHLLKKLWEMFNLFFNTGNCHFNLFDSKGTLLIKKLFQATSLPTRFTIFCPLSNSDRGVNIFLKEIETNTSCFPKFLKVRHSCLRNRLLHELDNSR